MFNNFKIINLLIISFLITIDFLSKNWIINNINLNEKKKILKILNFIYLRNYGILFSFLNFKKNLYLKFIIFLSILILSILIFNWIIEKERKYIISYSLIISGGIGNLLNRIQHGFVIDFIDIHFKKIHFFLFNIADFNVLIGIILLFIKFILI